MTLWLLRFGGKGLWENIHPEEAKLLLSGRQIKDGYRQLCAMGIFGFICAQGQPGDSIYVGILCVYGKTWNCMAESQKFERESNCTVQGACDGEVGWNNFQLSLETNTIKNACKTQCNLIVLICCENRRWSSGVQKWHFKNIKITGGHKNE